MGWSLLGTKCGVCGKRTRGAVPVPGGARGAPQAMVCTSCSARLKSEADARAEVKRRGVEEAKKRAEVEAKQRESPADVLKSFSNASLDGDMEKVEALLNEHPDLVSNMDAEVRYTPLHYAAGNGLRVYAELLLAHGADINAKDNKGCTPLYHAAAFNRAELVALLLARGADTDAIAEEWGFTPLQQAANNGHRDVVELLLAHGADVNAKTDYGSTALSLATNYADRLDVKLADRRRHKAVVELLREHGAQ